MVLYKERFLNVLISSAACSFQICPDNAECVLVDSEASCQCIVGFEKNSDDDCVAGKCVTSLCL